MFVEQLSVFIENRGGRLEQVTGVLKEQDTNTLSLSMADTAECGMLRTVASDPGKAKAALREKGFPAMLTDVLAIKLEGQAGELHRMTHILYSQGLNIEYMYTLAPANRRIMITKTPDGEAAVGAMTDSGLILYSNEEMRW